MIWNRPGLCLFMGLCHLSRSHIEPLYSTQTTSVLNGCARPMKMVGEVFLADLDYHVRVEFKHYQVFFSVTFDGNFDTLFYGRSSSELIVLILF